MRPLWTLLVLLLPCWLVLSEKCSPNHVLRYVETSDGVIPHCCQRLSPEECPPGTEVKPCNKTGEPEWCKPCDNGLVQESRSGTGNERPCVQPKIQCTPEAELVLVDGSQECQCRAVEGYCGEPPDCLKEECREGFQLHHRHCCTPTETATPTTVSGRGTSMPPASPTPSPPASDPASTTEPDNSGGKRITDEKPTLPEDNNKEALPPGQNESPNQIIIIVFGVLVLAVVIALVLGVWWWRTRGRNRTPRILSIVNCFHPNISIQAPPDVERQDSSEALMGTSDLPVTTTAVPEERGPQPEEGSMGAAPDETMLKRSGSFYQELNPRTSVETV